MAGLGHLEMMQLEQALFLFLHKEHEVFCFLKMLISKTLQTHLLRFLAGGYNVS